MNILSLDLAYRDFAGNGIVVFERRDGVWKAIPIRMEPGPITSPAELLDRLWPILEEHSVGLIGIDGPQAWKDAENGCAHARLSEQLTATPGKTGLPESSLPANYLPFIQFSIEVFELLQGIGYPRYQGKTWPKMAVETFPTKAWRDLGLSPLGAKAKCSPADIAQAFEKLKSQEKIEYSFNPNHDELQAVVAGVGLVRLYEGRADEIRFYGNPPRLVDGRWREGFILTPASRIHSREQTTDGKGGRLSFRRANAADTDTIVEIRREAVMKSSSSDYGMGLVEHWSGKRNDEDLRHALADGEYWLACRKDGFPVGWGRLHHNKVQGLYVHPAHMGNHYGERILDFLEKRLIEDGVTESVLIATLSAIGFYAKQGYEPSEEHDYTDSQEMRKPLIARVDT